MDQAVQPESAVAAAAETLRQSDEQCAASRELSLHPLEAPAVSPGYEIISRLGTGSFGAVWLAREVKTGKQVAIKFYTHRRGLDWSLLTREVEKLAVLYTSREIVRLLDVGWDHDPPYFVMEFLEHGSLMLRLQSGRLPVATAVRIASSIARALVHAHGCGILHCDLKPANILLDASDEPRLGDFGQSRLTTEQSPALGTLFYMAPEQADFHSVPDARWDVYALGAVLYEMLTGAPPYRTPENERWLSGTSSLEERLAVYRRIIADSPRPDAHRRVHGVDKRLAAIVDGCLEADPQRRFPNPQVVLDRIEQRASARARRPLIALGFLGPILFMLAMFWIARVAVPRVVETAETNLLERALAGDAVSALILADSIQHDLSARRDQVESLARSPAVRTIARVMNGRTDGPSDAPRPLGLGQELLVRLIENQAGADPSQPAFAELVAAIEANERRLHREGRTEDTGWFITDAQGRQVFRYPSRSADNEPQRTIGESFHWRAYFTGLDADLPKTTPPGSVPPRQEPGVSPPFRSEATHQYMVAIVAPIWDEEHEEWVRQGQQGQARGAVIGVIASVIHISELLKQWEHTIRDPGAAPGTNDRFLALATLTPDGEAATLLDHPWMTADNLRTVAAGDSEEERNRELDAFMQRLRLSDRETRSLSRLMHGQRDHRESAYLDPFGQQATEFGGEWLAAFARVGQTNWIAIVQERRETAIRPVQEVNEIFMTAGVAAILVFGVLLAILWYFLNRASASA